ncbi:hypothetical protein DU43_18390 [Methanosarcina mazei]|uniref:Uncharacterized protein n=1 Tax=Methanosarcina mazei TaxID=2209 RepID=A0A0F8J2E1_METMZ|nr:hypothetical protein [Methanosarcina mazei]KKG69843.1 hypothetical protein DU43_18390 [Methanosarcina mazei]
MGDFSTLRVGKYQVRAWKYEIPPVNDPIINFIFKPGDKVIEEEGENGEKIYWCIYKTTVSEVKSRFEELHFTLNDLDNVISEITGIPLPEVERSIFELCAEGYQWLCDMDPNFSNPFEIYSIDDESGEGNEREEEETSPNIEAFELGNYVLLREIRTLLDICSDSDKVSLEMYGTLGYRSSPEEFNDVEIVSESSTDKIVIERKYLEMAKVHFTEYRFNLVYIELFISLEATLRAYLRKKSPIVFEDSNKILDLDGIFKPVSLMDLLRFSLFYIGKLKMDESINTVLDSVSKAYTNRNNVIHNNAKKFYRKDVVEAIYNVEKIIKIIKELA